MAVAVAAVALLSEVQAEEAQVEEVRSVGVEVVWEQPAEGQVVVVNVQAVEGQVAQVWKVVRSLWSEDEVLWEVLALVLEVGEVA